MMKSNVMKSNIMKDGMMIFTQSHITTLWDAFHITNEVCLCVKDAKTGWYFLCCHYDQTPGSQCIMGNHGIRHFLNAQY